MMELDTRLQNRLQARALRAETAVSRSPWLIFIFLFIVFAFATPYHLDYTVLEDDLDQQVERIVEGSLGRQLALPVLGAYGLGLILIGRKRRLQVNGGHGLAFVSFLAMAFISLFWAEDPLLVVKKLIVFGLLIIGAVGMAARFTLREIIIFTAFVSYGVIFLGLGAELGSGTFLRAREYSIYQFSGVMHPNATAAYCVVGCLSSLTLANLEPKRRNFYLFLTAVGAGGLLLTKSRTAFGSLMITLVVYWVLTTNLKHKILSILGIGVIVCALGMVFSEDLSERATGAFLMGRQEEGTAGSLSNRIPLWQECLDYVARHPLLGYGFDAFWTPQHIYAISKHQGWSVPHSHNGYLEVVLSLGVVGLLIYLVMLVSYLKTAFVNWMILRDPACLYGVVIIVWLCLEMCLERVYLAPVFPSFVCNLLIARSAFVHTEEQDLLINSPAL